MRTKYLTALFWFFTTLGFLGGLASVTMGIADIGCNHLAAARVAIIGFGLLNSLQNVQLIRQTLTTSRKA